MSNEKGVLIDSLDQEGGGWDIYFKDTKYWLWETPLYGGEPYIIDSYNSYDLAKLAANNLT